MIPRNYLGALFGYLTQDGLFKKGPLFTRFLRILHSYTKCPRGVRIQNPIF